MTNSYGASTWDDNPNTGNSNRENLQQIPFVRLQEGKNVVRIVTIPFKYYMVRVPTDPADKVGKRVNTAYPLYEDCPATAAGYAPKERYLVGVINRGAPGNEKQEIGLLDMSVLVHQQIKALKDDIEHGLPNNYDINVRVNRKGGAAGYYTVLPYTPQPLSEADVALIEAVGEDLEKTLVRRTTPPKSEYVWERMQKLGWKPEYSPQPKKAEKEELSGTDDADYSFEPQAAN